MNFGIFMAMSSKSSLFIYANITNLPHGVHNENILYRSCVISCFVFCDSRTTESASHSLLFILFSTMDRIRQIGPQPQQCHVIFLQQHRKQPQIQSEIICHPLLYLFLSTTRTASCPAARTLTGGKPRRSAPTVGVRSYARPATVGHVNMMLCFQVLQGSKIFIHRGWMSNSQSGKWLWQKGFIL